MATRNDRLTRRERLNRLRIGSACGASWDGMVGDERERYCAACHRSVVDFAQLTPLEIELRLQASRGNLCGRLSRAADGQLVTLRPRVEDLGGSRVRRASPAAAVFVTAFLGVGALKAQGSPAEVEESADTAARLAERAAEDSPDASADPLDSIAEPAADQDLATADLTAAQTESVTMGAVIAVEEPLRRVFVDSSLVVFAVAGETRVVSGEQGWGEVETELHVEEVLKGRLRRTRVLFRHYESLPEGGLEAEFLPLPGSEVLAFLNPVDPEDGGRRGRTFESADPMFGVRSVDSAERVVYRARIEDLARIVALEVPQPEDVTEWLVATAEELETRGEVTGELRSAFAELDSSAQRLGRTAEERAAALRSSLERFRAEGGRLEREASGAMLAASLTERQRTRLTEALIATRRLDDADLNLADLVRRWAPEAVAGWLEREARVEVTRIDLAEDPAVNVWRLTRLATALGRPALGALAETAEQEVAAIYARLAEEDAASDSERQSEEAPESYESRARPELEVLMARFLVDFAAQLDRQEP